MLPRSPSEPRPARGNSGVSLAGSPSPQPTLPGGGGGPGRPFVVRCAGPLYGVDATVAVRFAAPPQTLDEVFAAADAAFTQEAEHRRGPVAEGFRTARMRVYDWARKQWHDLADRRDWRGLLPGSVVFADPVAPVASVVDALDEDWKKGFERQDVPTPQKIRVSWEDFCGAGAGPIAVQQGGFSEQRFCQRMAELEVPFDQGAVSEIFSIADADGDGSVTLTEWGRWAESFPNTLECLYFRGRDKAEVDALNAAVADCSSQLKSHDEATRPLQDELRAASAKAAELAAEVARLEALQQELREVQEREQQLRAELGAVPAEEMRTKVVAMERRLGEFKRRRECIEPHERELMEQELLLERHRRALARQKEQMQGVVSAFDRATHRLGSPRRAVSHRPDAPDAPR
eukprot:TRINITY_DN28291_c0_g1_i1.p1 TRINITY_DN28291_c0_g1~~TRINITY_DN28291_c0_g1_i1.p1  ORF type:complete len:429 (+),score=147.56 TRINITY_DN28291_c0_g1_i1:79-1287(+)